METINYFLPIVTDFSASSHGWMLLYVHKFPLHLREADIETSHWQYYRCWISIHHCCVFSNLKQQDKLHSIPPRFLYHRKLCLCIQELKEKASLNIANISWRRIHNRTKFCARERCGFLQRLESSRGKQTQVRFINFPTDTLHARFKVPTTDVCNHHDFSFKFKIYIDCEVLAVLMLTVQLFLDVALCRLVLLLLLFVHLDSR